MTMNDISNFQISRSPYSRLLVLHDVQCQSDRMSEFVLRLEQISTRVHLGPVDNRVPHSLDVILVDSFRV